MAMKKHALLLVLLFLSAILVAGVRAANKPNILFIFADDQCFDTIRALGNDEIETPNLDRLVAQGTTFTEAYNMGSWSGAVCVASRMMLNTGKYLWHASRDYGKTTQLYQDKGLMWSQLMEKAGYDTYFTGKWHVRADATKIFKVCGSVRGGMPKQTKEGYNRPIDGEPDPWSPYDPKFGGFWEGGKHWSEVVKDDAVGFLEQSQKSEHPFFMYIAFNAPHDPRQAPKKYVDKYPLDQLELPANFLPEYPYKDKIDCGKGLRDEKLAPFPRTENSVKVNRQEYYAIITHMDTQIGIILDKLKATGQDKNTYIFFSADHGLAVGQHGLLGKQNLFDHSMRVPYIVVGPDVKAGARTEERIYLQSVLPSTLELAGAEIPDYVQFKSVMPILKGKAKGLDAVYGAYLKGQRAIVQDDYKLILYPRVPVTLLFNVKKDPLEMKNLAANPEHQERMKKMYARFIELQQEVGDEQNFSDIYKDLL